MSEKQTQQGKSASQTKTQKPKPPNKPLAPVEMTVENVWEAPVPAPEILREAMGDPRQVTPETLRSLQRTMGNGFTEQLSGQVTGELQGGNVSQALARVQALSGAGGPVAAQKSNESGAHEAAGSADNGLESGLEELSSLESLTSVYNLGMDGIGKKEKGSQVGDLTVQRAADPFSGAEIGGDIESDIDRQRGSGQALPDQTKTQMEGVLNSDLSDVRVHTDSKADSLSQSINAKAFTTGSDVFFSSGEYDTGSQEGQKLLAHELTHVVQQGASKPLAEDGTAQRSEEEDLEEVDGGEAEGITEAVPESEMLDRQVEASDSDLETEPTKVEGSNGELATDGVLTSQLANEQTRQPTHEQPKRRVIQPKMRVSHPDDKYEKEADAVAEKAIAPPTPAAPEAMAPEKAGPQKSIERSNKDGNGNADIGRGGGDSGGNAGGDGSNNGGSNGARSTGSRSTGSRSTGSRSTGSKSTGLNRQEGKRRNKGKPRPLVKTNMAEFGRNLGRLASESRSSQKPKMTKPGDRFEKEADRMAADVAGKKRAPRAPQRKPKRFEKSETQIARKVRTPEPKLFRQQISKNLEANLGDPRKNRGVGAADTIQRAVNEAVTLAHEHSYDPTGDTADVSRQIDGSKSSGRPLTRSTRQQMEQNFDADLSGVRVHTNSEANQLSRSLNAKAFTTGSDIFFDEGEYQPQSNTGQKLLAHELTHVMQQGAAPSKEEKKVESREGSIAQRKMRVSDPEDKYEKEADAVAETAVQRTPNLIQRDEDKPTMVKPDGEVKDDPPKASGGDSSPMKEMGNSKKKGDSKKDKEAEDAADSESKNANEKSKKSSGKAKKAADSNKAAAKGNQGKTGKGANGQKSEEQTLPGDATAALAQQPKTVEDASATVAKLDNFTAGAEKMPEVKSENVLPNWSDLTAGTIQLAEKEELAKEEKKDAAVEGAKGKQGGKKKAQEPKEIKPKPKNEKAKKGAEQGAKAAQAAGKAEKDDGGGEKVVPQVEVPEKAPAPPPLPDLPKPSEMGGVANIGTPPTVDTQSLSQEIAWMQSPRMKKISKIVNEGTLDQKVQDAQQKKAEAPPKGKPAKKETEKGKKASQKKKAQRIQRTPAGVSTFSDPAGFKRSNSGSGLWVPDAPSVENETVGKPNYDIVLPPGAGHVGSSLSSSMTARAARANGIQRSPVALGGLSNEVNMQAMSGGIGGEQIQRQGADSGIELDMFGFLGGDLASMFAGGGGAQALMDGGLDIGMQGALSGAGGGGFAENMLSSGGAMDVLGGVGMNTAAYANDLPLPDPNFVKMAAEQYSPTVWFDQTVGDLGAGAEAVAGGFASVGSEGTVWGKIAATMEALGSVIDLISQILDIVSLVLMIIDIICTVMIALAPLTIIVVLVPVFPFIWTPGVFSPIKTGVASASRILDKIADVLGIVGDVLLQGASVFRILDMLETLADPKPSEERQNAMDESMNLFVDEAMNTFNQSMGDHASQAGSARESIMDGQKQRMQSRKNNKGNGDTPPEPPMGLPPLPPEASPDSFSDFGDTSGDLAAQEQALLMQQEEISNLMEMGEAGMEAVESTRNTNKANRKGADAHKKDMNKKKTKQKSMKKSAGGSKGKMGKGKSKGGKGKALMGLVMPMIMPLISFGMSFGAGNAETGEAESGAGTQATQMAGFFSANSIADVLSAQRIVQTTQLIASATKTDEKLGGLDSFLGEKFDLGMATMGLLTQDAGLIADQLSLVQEDRQNMLGMQEQSAGAAASWMESSRQTREQMFAQLEMGLGMMGGDQ